MTDEKISSDRMDEILRALFRELKAMGGQANGTDVIAAIEPKLDLTDYEKAKVKSGAVRWETHLRFYTSDCVKAGYIQKSDGQWTLTEKGEKALALPPGELMRQRGREARAWYKEHQKSTGNENDSDRDRDENADRFSIVDRARDQARKEINERINGLSPYDFQNLVAELLRAMDYYVTFVAPPGRDGGVDIVAYKDALGTTTPRITVQVKHRPDSKVASRDIREMDGLLRKDGDIGLIVSSGGFTADTERELRASPKRIETMDLNRLVELWQKHYDKVGDAGKALLPLVKVYFLAPEEE